MNQTINIGIPIDLQKLLDTRLLIQAGSGGGKSYLLRKLIESIGKNVQQIILDPEGEFVTLREKFDFVLIGKGGDIPLNLKYAETLAHKLLENNLSAIVDLYELKHYERILFVKRFLDAIVNAPKELWHPCFVHIDEAHIFCPESSKSESMSAVIDICTRGRKRGFAAILATQRLSKLHKDAAAECMNKMIGSTGLDIDRKRAGEELGMTKKEDILNLRQLLPGEFYAFGPAIKNEVTKFKVLPVITTHLQSGKRISTVIPQPDAIKKILSKLSDIPEEAEKELTTRQQLQAEVTRLRNELKRSAKPVGPFSGKPENTAQIDGFKRDIAVLKETVSEINRTNKTLNDRLSFARSKMETIKDLSFAFLEAGKPGSTSPPATVITSRDKATDHLLKAVNSMPIYPAGNTRRLPVKSSDSPSGIRTLGKCARTIITFLASMPERTFTKPMIGVACGYSIGSGGFNNALSELNSKGYIIRGERLQVNHDMFDAIKEELGGRIEMVDYDIETFKSKLGKCEREIYEVLLENPEVTYSKEILADATETGYSPGSGGFNNALSRLSSLELISRSNGAIKLNPELLELM